MHMVSKKHQFQMKYGPKCETKNPPEDDLEK